LILYLDASALVKRYVREQGSDLVRNAMSTMEAWAMCRVGFVETIGAIARGGEDEDVARAKSDWVGFHVVELSQALTEHAAELGIEHGLRALDAIHLAAALSIGDGKPIFATWDVRLHRAARGKGLHTLPASL
jgi:predicted nucleic acid-binding protein